MNYYVYLISSLPMLHFGAKNPFSFDRFLQICDKLISEEDMEILRRITQAQGDVYEPSKQPARLQDVHALAGGPTLRRWGLFDTALRNELVRIRSSRKKIDPLKYLRRDGIADSFTTHIAVSAYRNPSPLESEKILDQERWCFLDELAAGHYFDIDFLIIYACKLSILEKWARIAGADKARLVEETLSLTGS